MTTIHRGKPCPFVLLKNIVHKYHNHYVITYYQTELLIRGRTVVLPFLVLVE